MSDNGVWMGRWGSQEVTVSVCWPRAGAAAYGDVHAVQTAAGRPLQPAGILSDGGGWGYVRQDHSHRDPAGRPPQSHCKYGSCM